MLASHFARGGAKEFIAEILAGKICGRMSGQGENVSFNTPGVEGVPVSHYYVDDMRAAISQALLQNPTSRVFILPRGEYEMNNQLSEADGLRSGLEFHGYGCHLYRRGVTGQMFRWNVTGVDDVHFRGVTLELTGAPTQFSAVINASVCTNWSLKDCRFIGDVDPASLPTGNGIRNAVNIFGADRVSVDNCRFEATQLLLGGNGRPVARSITVVNNRFYDCNDCGISIANGEAVGGGDLIEDVLIANNRFRNMHGACHIYVGSDARGPGFGDHPDIRDLAIIGNVCSGELYNTFGSQPRTGIQVFFGNLNERIIVANNTVHGFGAVDGIIRGIQTIPRATGDGIVQDLIVSNNIVAFQANDTHESIYVGPFDGNNVDVSNNQCRGGRGMRVDNCSDASITNNRQLDSLSWGLEVGAPDTAIDRLDIKDNQLHTAAAFRSGVYFSGDNNISAEVEGNLLRSTLYAVQNALTGGATLTFGFQMNRHDQALGGGATPVAGGVGNRSI